MSARAHNIRIPDSDASALVGVVLAAGEAQDRLHAVYRYQEHGLAEAAAFERMLSDQRAEQDRRKRSAAARGSRREAGEPKRIALQLGVTEAEIPEWNRLRLKKFSYVEAAEIIIRSRRA